MAKSKQSTQLLVGPTPAALIACGDGKEQNIITLAWVGVVNSSPPMVSISVRPNRHSYNMIKKTGEFTVNIPREDQVDIVDGCGTISGRELEKFEHFQLTPVLGSLVNAPMILECPISMECELKHSLDLASHTVFIGQVVSSYVEDGVLNEKGAIDFERCRIVGFCSGNYLKTEPLNLKLGYTLKNKS